MDSQIIAPTLTPTVMYNDAGQAIRWLTDVLRFKAAAVFLVLMLALSYSGRKPCPIQIRKRLTS
jgi:hypothetical protein